MSRTVDFGFTEVSPAQKTRRVGEVFTAVAPYYDLMNDLMSAGMHRIWKSTAARLLDAAPHMRVLDIAAGSGDMAVRLASAAGAQNIVLTDINPAMLAAGRARLPAAAAVIADGEQLPFADRSFDRAVIAFGLRNVTDRPRLLRELHRVLKTGGKYGILEFSPAGRFPRLQKCYLTRALPLLGAAAAADAASYRYLGESILRFPPPAAVTAMLQDAGLAPPRLHRFAAGAVCLHLGRRPD